MGKAMEIVFFNGTVESVPEVQELLRQVFGEGHGIGVHLYEEGNPLPGNVLYIHGEELRSHVGTTPMLGSRSLQLLEGDGLFVMRTEDGSPHLYIVRKCSPERFNTCLPNTAIISA